MIELLYVTIYITFQVFTELFVQFFKVLNFNLKHLFILRGLKSQQMAEGNRFLTEIITNQLKYDLALLCNFKILNLITQQLIFQKTIIYILNILNITYIPCNNELLKLITYYYIEAYDLTTLNININKKKEF